MSESEKGSDLIHRHLSEFGKGTIEELIPNAIDGLKYIHRRILLSVRGKTGVIHSPSLIGDTNKLHPAEGSIYNAAFRLSQSFECNPPLLDFRSESSGGTYSSPTPGAPRYTSCRVPEFTTDVFFKGIEFKALPKQLDASQVGYEPSYLVPAIPTALLYANISIGYGDSSRTVPHNLGDVCDLVVAYCNYKKSKTLQAFDYTKHIERFLPDFPVYGILANAEELIEAYKSGDFSKKIFLDGEVKLTQDAIQIKTLPYGVPFKNLESTIQGLMSSKDNKGGWFDKNLVSVKDLSNENDIGDITVVVKRGVNVFEAWDLLRKKIQFSSTVSPIANYNDKGYVVEISQPNLLATWYNVRYNILVSSKKIEIMSLTENLRKVEAVLVVCNHVDEVTTIIKTNRTRQASVEALMKRFDPTYFQATYLTGAPLHTLSPEAPLELEEKKNSLVDAIVKIQDSFALIPDEIAKTAMDVKKKYNTPRRTRIPNYLGYVRIGGGCIQYESSEEIAQIIADFPKVEMEIHTYDGPHLYKVGDNSKLEKGYVPKITTGDIYGLKSTQIVTVNIVDGTACCVRGFIPGLRKEGYFYTTPRSRVICRNGDIKTVDVTEEISLRKTICRGANTNVIYVYPDIKQDHYVFVLNTNIPNVIHVQKVTANSSKVGMNPSGEVLLFHSTNKHTFFNVPQKFLSRSSVRVIEIIDVEKLLDGSDKIRLDIASQKVKTDKNIRLL